MKRSVGLRENFAEFMKNLHECGWQVHGEVRLLKRR